LRAFLASQQGFAHAHNLRQTLLFALTATSLVPWVFAAWPELLDHADYLIGVIRSAAREGFGTDESISLVPIQDVVRIRTRQHGSEAL
jgi:hypothetical protein